MGTYFPALELTSHISIGTIFSQFLVLKKMRSTAVALLAFVLLYNVAIAKGFGVSYARCTKIEALCLEDALGSLNTMNPIDTVYLDFDKTITVNGYSEKVRNDLCQQKYPSKPTSPTEACTDFDASDAMAMVKIIEGNDTETEKLRSSLTMGIIDFLKELRSRNITVKIVSTSWYPITAEQWQEYLYHVSNLLGLGFLKEEILTVDDPGPGLSADKGKKIRDDKNIDVFLDNAMFADDSSGNIKSSTMVCNTLYIIKRKGLSVADMKYIKASTMGCPDSHPYAYYNGKYCCSSDSEKIYEDQGTKCDGSKIQYDSLCCNGDDFMKGPLHPASLSPQVG